MSWSRFSFLLISIILLVFSSTGWSVEKFYFAVFGDSAGGDDIYLDLIKRVNAEPGLAFAVHLGDFVPMGKYHEYVQYRKLAKKFKMPVYHLMGNHEAVYGGWRNYRKFFGDDYYSFDYANSHFVVLDNAYDRSFTEAEFTWLQNDLAKNHTQNTFVFLHRPLFDPTGMVDDYCMESRTKAVRLQKLFEKYKVKIVFSGHIHGFLESSAKGVCYVVSGGAGSPIYLPQFMGGFFHYIVVQVDGDRVTYNMKRVYD